MQDADASDLGRLTLSKPVRAEDIFLRTQEAKKFYLPHVAQRIERVSRLMTTTDAYEAQLPGRSISWFIALSRRLWYPWQVFINQKGGSYAKSKKVEKNLAVMK